MRYLDRGPPDFERPSDTRAFIGSDRTGMMAAHRRPPPLAQANKAASNARDDGRYSICGAELPHRVAKMKFYRFF
ncbi:hypothetical protein GCM10007858_73570 [Bradyrhizobium liaoningense]|nr:hypothetical protein GCM10007858_73570 [Bradyrhizobium liaoningense]